MKAAVPYAAIHRGLAQTGDAVDADVPPSKRRRLTTPATSECGISQSQPSRTRQNTPMVNSARASATPVRIKQRPDPSVTAASPSPDHQDMSMQSQPSHTRQSTPVVDSAPASDTPRRAKQQQDPSAPSASPAPDHPEMSMQSQPSRTLQSTPVVDNALASATPGQQQDPIVPAASPAPDHPEMSMQSQLSQTRQSTPMVDSVPAPVATPGRSTPRPDPTVPAASPAPDHPGMSTPVMTDAESDAVSECSTVDARAAMIEDDSLPEFEMLKMEQVLSHSWVPYDEPGHDAIWLPDELYALLSRMQRTLDVEILARKKWEKYYLEELRKRCRADILIEELQEKIQSLSAPVQTNSTSSTANCAQLSNSQPLPQVPVHFNTTTSTTIKRSRRNSF
ncbi:hypothetical protein PLICRDRAFT_384859 [Plicaturopsis crispa FD-325 SS-3]|nr:hypothetical protein PLICRDRAFT_384859 [Plicaturopsis crispa FD-325 SS-3]